MGTVHRLDTGSTGPALGDAVAAFLREVDNPNTARSYGIALRALVAELGVDAPVAVLDNEAVLDRIAMWFAGRWGSSAAATANVRLDGLRSAAGWWRDQRVDHRRPAAADPAAVAYARPH